jgi:aldehyde dehydrogenase (NAD+)
MGMQNLLNNKWVDSVSGRTFENRNPADQDDIIGVFPRSEAEDVNATVNAARNAFKTWRLVPAPKRGDVVRRAGDILTRRKEEIARAMTREMGKPLIETRGDVQEAIDTAYYAAGEGRRLFGLNAPSELPDKMNMSVRVPIGVCGIITAWNFPIAVPSWKILPAIVAGNTVVFKPSEDAPHSANLFAECLLEAGLPEGVLNIVHGLGEECGDALVQHHDVNVIAFTGSTAVGKQISAKASQTLKRVSLELGGKNAQIVMDDADQELALEGVLWGAFGTTGQRCTATSRLILHESIYDTFINKLISRATKLKIGDGSKAGTEVGPVINEKQIRRIEEYVRIGKEEGALCVLGGDRETKGECTRGWFFKPTIFIDVAPNMRIAREEIFGPVLSIMRTSSLEDAIALLNDTNYGLSSSIYTQNVNNSFRAIRDIESGIVYVNVPTIGAEAHMPFGGVKETGNGHREGGWTVFDIFTEWKSIYIDFSGKLQKAQIDNN